MKRSVLTLHGASIEGAYVAFKARKYLPLAPVSCVTFHVRYPFNLDIEAKAWIEKELDPKVCRHQSTSKLDFGTELTGQKISGFSTSHFKPRVGPGSGRHKANLGSLQPFGYAELKLASRELLAMRNKQGLPLSIEKSVVLR